MKERLTDFGLLLLRVMFGCGIIHAGYLKIFGGIMPMFIQGVDAMGFPMPTVFAWMAALSEFAGGILIVLGLCTRIAAFFISCTLMVATFIASAPGGLDHMQTPLAYLVAFLTLLLTGSGRFALGRCPHANESR